MKGVILSMKEDIKYKTIKNLVEKDGNKYRVATKLAVSPRTVDRYIKGYKEFGKDFFRHKNHDNKPISTIPKEIKDKIVNLYLNKYNGFNFKHFNEFLKKDENIIISYTALYKLMKENNIISNKARRATKRYALKAIDQEVIRENSDIVIMESKEIPLQQAHPRQERSKYFGEVIQLDASNHLWFGHEKMHLHLAIDDATSRIVAAVFHKEETLQGYYDIFNEILNNYGIPYKFFTDKRTVFTYNSKSKKSLEKDTFTQFSFACSLLGVELETSSIPQTKGKVERSFNTHQDRLINELKLANITTLEEANLYLKDYIIHHNNKFALPLNNIISVFEKQEKLEDNDLILAIRYSRKIDSGHCIKFKNKYYQTIAQDGRLVTLKPKSKCMVIESYSKGLYLECADQIYNLDEVLLHKAHSKNIDLEIAEAKPRKVNKPASNHPWKNDNILKHQQRLKESIPILEQYFKDCDYV